MSPCLDAGSTCRALEIPFAHVTRVFLEADAHCSQFFAGAGGAAVIIDDTSIAKYEIMWHFEDSAHNVTWWTSLAGASSVSHESGSWMAPIFSILVAMYRSWAMVVQLDASVVLPLTLYLS